MSFDSDPMDERYEFDLMYDEIKNLKATIEELSKRMATKEQVNHLEKCRRNRDNWKAKYELMREALEQIMSIPHTIHNVETAIHMMHQKAKETIALAKKEK